jgi:hypothetical protein
VHQNHFVYIPLYKDSIEIQLKSKTGSWSTINKSESKVLIHDKVFMPSIIHSPFKKASGYVVGYAATPQQAAFIAGNPTWKVLRNDNFCQAVSFDKRTIMAALYKTGETKISSMLSVSIDKPCLLLISGEKIYVSDPGHTGGQLSVRINNRNYSVCLPPDGTTVLLR